MMEVYDASQFPPSSGPGMKISSKPQTYLALVYLYWNVFNQNGMKSFGIYYVYTLIILQRQESET
jgi:hypothetical protein